MLKKLRIQNFKGWKDTGTIRMAPISLFFGANSSGKSSIGQFLMMLKQTIESSDRKAVFFPGSNNSAVQLGSFHEMVYRRNLRKRIKFEYAWELINNLKFKDSLSGTSYLTDQIEFMACIGLEDDDFRIMCVERLRYGLPLKKRHPLSVGMERTTGKKHQYRVDAERYKLKRNPGRVWHPGAPVQFYGFPDEVVAYYQNAEFVKELNLQHETLFKSIFYLGPLRTKADRVYTWSGNAPEGVGFSGENTIAAILSARNRNINIVKPGAKRASPAKPFEEIIALKLKEMGLIESFSVENISEQLYKVKVQANGSKDQVDLPDVGFGISQVLPVLVQCFYAPAGSIILMEQPEIHLHPSAQSALADVVIDVINSRENGANRNIQLIIETHSEHFLRRLQRRIAEDVLPAKKISAYFANITKTPATLEPLQIDLFGNIQNWPPNFFGDEMSDITEQAKAAMKKRRQQSTKESEVSE